MQKCDFTKAAQQKFLHKSAFLEMSTSLDDINIKVITIALTSVMLVLLLMIITTTG